jgi:hypothetical protein
VLVSLAERAALACLGFALGMVQLNVFGRAWA